MRFTKESRIAAPPSVVFAFHESRGALERLAPPGNRIERIEGGESLRPGRQVVLKIHLGPLALRWVAEHTAYEPGHLFADRQVSGPFRRWEHRHLFLEDGQGGTILRDEVDYEPPLGWLGRVLGQAFFNKVLGRMFDFRHDATRSIVESRDFSTDSTLEQRISVPSPTSRADDPHG